MQLPYEEESAINTVKDGSFCRDHAFMAMPAFVKFLKTHGTQLTGVEVSEGGGVPGDAEEEEEDWYDTIMVDHFNPAFVCP